MHRLRPKRLAKCKRVRHRLGCAHNGECHGGGAGRVHEARFPQPVQPKRPAYILWAVLIASIYEAFPLLCPICTDQIRAIAFMTYSADIRHILEHIGAQTEPSLTTPAHGPPMWAEAAAQGGEGVESLRD